MPLQNFVAKVGPAISAAWLNSVDALKFTVFGDATTPVQARTNLTSDAPLEIGNGGTGTRGSGPSFLAFLASFFPSLYQYINPATQAEISASVTPADYSYLPFDLRRYGADPTGVAASDAAMTSAIAVCGTTGGTVRAPAGVYKFANQIGLNTKVAPIIIQGDGGVDAGSQPATQLIYTGTGSGLFIDMRSSFGAQIRDCQILHNNAGYTGTYIKCGNDGTHGDPAFCGLRDCALGSSINGVGNVHLDLDKCTRFTADNCNFTYGNPSVKGANTAGGSYSNVVRFRDCQWGNNYVTPVNSQGQAWTFEGCTFEPLTTGAAGALAGANTSAPAVGLVIKGCWFGDVTNTAPAGTWLDGCFSGALITGNYLSGNVTSNNTTAIALRQASGVAILANSFNSMLNAINFAVANCTGIVSRGNIANVVTNIYVNPANVPLGHLDFSLGFGFGIPTGHGSASQNGYCVLPGGVIKQFGFATGLSNGNNTITFPIPFPNACLNIIANLSGVLATTARAQPGTPTATNFVLTINDAGAVADTAYWEAVGN